MADIPADDREPLDLRAVIEDIDRTRTETQKFSAEQRKRMAEAAKPARNLWLVP